MDLGRLNELFVTEAREHLRLLGQSILALESAEEGGAGAALDEAFRAVHTLKGLAATMGHATLTDRSHTLEDRLAELRAGGVITRETVDELLAGSDALERAVDEALAAGPAVAAEGVEAGVRVRVRIRPDAPLRAARAALVVRAVERTGFLASHEPASFEEELTGDLVLNLLPGADLTAVESAAHSAGDVDEVRFEQNTADAHDRAPAAHVRVERRRLDDLAEGVGELAVLHARTPPGGNGTAAALDRMGALLSELQHAVLSMRMVPLAEVFDRFPRMVRDAARSLGKEVDFRVEGGEIELDRAITDELTDPLVHLIRNAVDHGIETPPERRGAGKAARAKLALRAERERSSVRIEVSDDGRGIDRKRVAERGRALGLVPAGPGHSLTNDDVLRLLCHPGFSTAELVTDVSGRGVGLDAVANRVRALGGAIDLTSVPGTGTTFTLRLPLTLALAQALRVRVGGEDYAIPITHVREALELDGVMLVGVSGREAVRVRDDLLPLVRLRRVLQIPGEAEEKAAVIAELGERRAALAVDQLVGREQILIKPFDAPVGTLPVFSGATLLADGRPALIVDPLSVL